MLTVTDEKKKKLRFKNIENLIRLRFKTCATDYIITFTTVLKNLNVN